MDCPRCEELMFASLDGPLSPADEEARSTHAAGCISCRALEKLMLTDAPALHAVPPADFVESVLIATSPGWARTFERLDSELTELAMAEPDDDFVADVLAATTGMSLGATSTATSGTTWAAMADHLAATWDSLLRRPRLAFEGAYVGALVLVLIVGTPAWSLSISPTKFINEIRQERVEPMVASVSQRVEPVVSSAGASVSGFVSGTWSDAKTEAREFRGGIQAAIGRSRDLWCETIGCDIDPTTEQAEGNSTRRNQ